MNYRDAKQKLQSIGQLPLLSHFDSLSENQKRSLLSQINALDCELFLKQQKLIRESVQQRDFTPCDSYDLSGNQNDRELGERLLKEGKVGCLIIAGGQATRLKLDCPKGTYPVTPIRKKSLFQLFAEKTAAASHYAGKPLPLAIMTSPLNHQDTVDFFREQNFFGLPSSQVDFFSQKTLPMLTPEGNLFLTEPGCIATGPDGNGEALSHFARSPIFSKWREHGVEVVNFILIDNPLADPFDLEMAGRLARTGSDVVIKAVKREYGSEKVGVIALQDGKPQVIEYSELPPDPQLRYRLANISLFSFSLTFIERSAALSLPLHLAFKAAKALDPAITEAWKFERFIFDLLPFSEKTEVLAYPREECFAPLKNSSGNDSPETVETALLERDRRQFERVTGKKPPDRPFELSQEFYYPTPEFLKRWREMPVPEDNYFA